MRQFKGGARILLTALSYGEPWIMTADNITEPKLDPAFVEKLYEEAMALVRETATYLGVIGSAGHATIAEEVRSAFTGESLRLTTQLLQVVSWLLAQRAVSGGEITMVEALSPQRRLSGRDICLGEPLIDMARLPVELAILLHRSRHLYERVERLEGQLLAGQPPHNPLDTLLNRLRC